MEDHMSESVLKEIFPYFNEKTTSISRNSLNSLKKSNGNTQGQHNLKPEVINKLISEITAKKSVNRAELLETVLFSSDNETIKKSVIQGPGGARNAARCLAQTFAIQGATDDYRRLGG